MHFAMEPCNWDAQPWLCLYAEARQWQTGIGALLGFLALMAAALFNFSLNRRRDRQLRREEMLSVAAALYGEILLFRKELAVLASAVKAYKAGIGEHSDLLRCTPGKPLIYQALAYKLGLLPSELVLGIVQFYDHVEGARRGLEGFGRPAAGVIEPEDMILEDAQRGIEEAKPVLRSIEHLADIRSQVKDARK